MSSWRKCVFGCETFRSLFGIPKKKPLRQKWLDSIGRVRIKSKNIQQQFVCDRHFSEDCLVNLGLYKSGLAMKLHLRSDSFPTIETDEEGGVVSKSNCASRIWPKLCAEFPPTENKEMPIPCLPTTGHNTHKQEQSEGVSKAKKDELDRTQDETISMSGGNAFERLRDFRDLKGFKSDAEVATFLLDRTTKRSKLESDRRRQKTRINIGPAFEQWRTLRAALGMKNDPHLALLLLERYEKTRAANAPSTSLKLRNTVSAEESDSVYSKDAQMYYQDVLKKLSVNELKDELRRRGLDTSGLKPIQLERLLTAPKEDARAKSPDRREEEQSHDRRAGNDGDERQQQQEEDKGRDWSGCHEQEDIKPCVNCEPCDSQLPSDLDHSRSDLNIDANRPKAAAIAEIDVKLEPEEEEYVHIKQESIESIHDHNKLDLDKDAAHPKMAAIAEIDVKLEPDEKEYVNIKQESLQSDREDRKPDLNIDAPHPKTAAIAEIDVKLEPDEEEYVHNKQESIPSNPNHSEPDSNIDANHPKTSAIAEIHVKVEPDEEEYVRIKQESIPSKLNHSEPDLKIHTNRPKTAAIAKIDVKLEPDEEEYVHIKQEIKMEVEDVPVAVANNGWPEPKYENDGGSSAVPVKVESERSRTHGRKRPHEENGDFNDNKHCKEQRISTTAEIVPYAFDPESEEETEGEEPPPRQARLKMDVSEWCTCGNCCTMQTEVENVCCRESPMVAKRMEEIDPAVNCMTRHPGFIPVCLNKYSLQNALNIYKADYGKLQVKGYKSRLRKLACRSFVSWCWGFLGKEVRVAIPSCVVQRIHRRFPIQQANPPLSN
ncbi:uncharacterized protein LOC144052679 isoform X2 [Vanacampus margaritifer]